MTKNCQILQLEKNHFFVAHYCSPGFGSAFPNADPESSRTKSKSIRIFKTDCNMSRVQLNRLENTLAANTGHRLADLRLSLSKADFTRVHSTIN
jgi:hypothetical protein